MRKLVGAASHHASEAEELRSDCESAKQPGVAAA